MLLTWLIVVPALGGVLAWALARLGDRPARVVALAACVLDLGLVAGVLSARPGVLSSTRPVLEESVPWIAPLGVRWHLGLDGLSLVLVALTALLGAVAVASSWREVKQRSGAFHFLLLLLLSGVIGVFLALDLFLFYFFWELMLVPMYFLVALWGHEHRVRAALKFFIYTFAGGLLMLVAILGLYFATGRGSFDLPDLVGAPLDGGLAFWLMLGFFVAFAVKLPVVPLHAWLPDTHTEAPTAGSVILAGVMLKTGAYGFLRFAIPLFPEASAVLAPWARLLGVAGILAGAVLAYPQRDFKRLVAFTSISHLGFVLLGIYAGTPLALAGAVMGMVSHGLGTGALFVISGMIKERAGTRELAGLGGLWSATPRLGGFTLLFAVAALGLPGLASFIAEILVLLGTWPVSPVLTVLAALGVVLSVVYSLRMVQDSVFGPARAELRGRDLDAREWATLGVLAVALVVLGLYPRPVLDAAAAPRATVGPALQGQASGGGR